MLASIGEPGSRLTPTKLRALEFVAERGGVRVGDLAAGLYIDETTATRLADRLEASGLAARIRVASDKRAVEVVLTAKAKRLVAVMADRRHEFFREMLEALEPEERVELVRLSAKATEALRDRARELVAR